MGTFQLRPFKMILRLLLLGIPATGASGADWNDPSALFDPGTLQRQSFTSAELETDGADYFSSFVDHGNRDFNRFLALCGAIRRHALSRNVFYDRKQSACLPGERGGLIVDARGPGVLSRLWLTSLGPGSEKLFGNELIHIWRDGELLVSSSLESWTRSQERAPLGGIRYGAFHSYDPIPYRESLRIFIDRLAHSRLYYYQADTLNGAATVANQIPNADALSTIQRSAHTEPKGALWSEWSEQHQIAPSIQMRIEAIEYELSALNADLKSSLSTQLSESQDSKTIFSLPIRSLFGMQAGWSTLQSQHARVEKKSGKFIARLSLPVALNNGLTLTSDVPVRVLLAPTAVQMQTQLKVVRATLSENPGPNFKAIDLPNKRGRLAGITLWQLGKKAKSGFVTDPMVYLEGDERLSIDGRVVTRGTGTEDFFNGGWYFRGGVDQLAWFGLTRWSRRGHEGESSAYRWFSGLDVVSFDQSLSLEFEKGPGKPEVLLGMESVSFLYLEQN